MNARSGLRRHWTRAYAWQRSNSAESERDTGNSRGGDRGGSSQMHTQAPMKPTSLHPGTAVVIEGRRMTFIRRDRDTRPPQNVFQCNDFIGLDGAEDNGLCTVTDYRVSRFMKPATQKGAQ